MLAQICLFPCTPNSRYSWLLILHEYLIREEWSEIEREARKQLKADCTKWRPLNEESVYLIRDEEREWVGERGRERQKEGHSPASDESERGGNILKGSRASKSERKTERGGRTQGRKQCAPLILVKIQRTRRASGLAHFYCSLDSPLPRCFSH